MQSRVTWKLEDQMKFDQRSSLKGVSAQSNGQQAIIMQDIVVA